MANEELQTIPILDVDDEAEEMSFDSLYTFLLEKNDIVITIDKEALGELRKGLSQVKYTYERKMKAAEVKVDKKVLKFNVLDNREGIEENQIKVQIWLAKPSGIMVHKITVSDSDF